MGEERLTIRGKTSAHREMMFFQPAAEAAGFFLNRIRDPAQHDSRNTK